MPLVLWGQDSRPLHISAILTESVKNCWKALVNARSLRWVGGLEDDQQPQLLDVDMAIHYSRPANGNINVLIPGQLLFFPTPDQLPPGPAWADTTRPGQPPARLFGAAYFADVLADLDVAAVACLGRADGGDAAALEACGLDVHELGLDARRGAAPRAGPPP